MEEKKNCPECGREMLRGSLQLFSSHGCSLTWNSDNEYPQKSRNPFSKKKMVDKTIRLKLMTNGFNSIDTQEESRYCPGCGRIFASFKVEKNDVSY